MADWQQISLLWKTYCQLIMKERISHVCWKTPLFCLGEGRKFGNLHSCGWYAMCFPKNVWLQLLQDSTLLWIGRCVTDKFCSSTSFQRQYCNFCLEYIFWKRRTLFQLMFFLQLLFSFIAVVQMRIIPRKVYWRVKNRNTFTPTDSTFLSEVAFISTSTAKNKI